jgi:hypothetical protein
MDLLDAEPTIACYDELFLAGATGNGYWGRTDREFFEPYYKRHRRRDNPYARAILAFRYLDSLYAPRENTEAIGMKLMYEQVWKNPLLWAYMIRRQVRVVHMVRRNLLDIVVSEETARARDRFHAFEGQVVDTPSVTLDPRHVVSMLTTLERRVRIAHLLVALLPLPHFETSYERLRTNPSCVDEIMSFLGVPVRQSRDIAVSRFKKLNTSKKSELIDNYAEIQLALTATRFQRFLD